MAQLTVCDARALEGCLAAGGTALFPADTVYGLACDPDDAAAAARVYRLKRRPHDKPAAVMFFDPEPALAAIAPAGPRTLSAARALLPGPVTLLVANPQRRFLVACGPQPETLGVRVPALPFALAALAAVRRPLLQTSANVTGGAEARRLDDVAPVLRAGVDLALDGGELPGTASTVIDLRGFDADGRWGIVREGALAAQEVDQILARC